MLIFKEFSDKYIKENPEAAEWSHDDMLEMYYDYQCELRAYEFYCNEDYVLDDES